MSKEIFVVRQVFDDDPSIVIGSHNEQRHTFVDKLLTELRKKSKRWGYRCNEGDCNRISRDAILYYCGSPAIGGNGSRNTVSIDPMIQYGSNNLRPAWQNQGITGAIWKYPR